MKLSIFALIGTLLLAGCTGAPDQTDQDSAELNALDEHAYPHDAYHRETRQIVGASSASWEWELKQPYVNQYEIQLMIRPTGGSPTLVADQLQATLLDGDGELIERISMSIEQGAEQEIISFKADEQALLATGTWQISLNVEQGLLEAEVIVDIDYSP